MRTMTGWRSVQRTIGTYVFCNRVTGWCIAASSSIVLASPSSARAAVMTGSSPVERRPDGFAGSMGRFAASRRSVRHWASVAARSRFQSFFWSRVSFASLPRRDRNQYASTGTIVRATKREASSATEAVRAKGRNSSPVCPPTNATGRNTATVTRVEAVIAVATSPTAARMFSALSPPSACRRRIASTTTIESSTTRPMLIVSAASVSMLRV